MRLSAINSEYVIKHSWIGRYKTSMRRLATRKAAVSDAEADDDDFHSYSPGEISFLFWLAYGEIAKMKPFELPELSNKSYYEEYTLPITLYGYNR